MYALNDVSNIELTFDHLRLESMARPPNLRITSDDINALIYSYLEDAGYQHTSYALRHEARLDASPNLNVRIPRGELIKLLNKALLYSEAEAHFKRVGP